MSGRMQLKMHESYLGDIAPNMVDDSLGFQVMAQDMLAQAKKNLESAHDELLTSYVAQEEAKRSVTDVQNHMDEARSLLDKWNAEVSGLAVERDELASQKPSSLREAKEMREQIAAYNARIDSLYAASNELQEQMQEYMGDQLAKVIAEYDAASAAIVAAEKNFQQARSNYEVSAARMDKKADTSGNGGEGFHYPVQLCRHLQSDHRSRHTGFCQ